MNPIRPQDYQALAEENRQLRVEVERFKVVVERLRDRPARKARLVRLVRDICFWTGLSVAGLSLVFGLGAWAESCDAPKRKTPCYFTRHWLYEENEEKADPWDKWRIFRSDKEGATNHEVDSAGKFATKDEAWAFMMKWKLPVCK